MLFRKYHIVVFKDNEGLTRKIRLRGWIVLLFVLLLGGLAAANFHLLGYIAGYAKLTYDLSKARKTVDDQKSQLLSLGGKLNSLEKDLSRIRDFDAKLRMLINMDEYMETATGGPTGSKSKDATKSYLPVYRQELLARKMHTFIHELNTEAKLEEVKQTELLHAFSQNRDLLAGTPAIWPTEGWITQNFGKRISPFTGRSEFFQGVAITGKIGTPVYSAAKGVVTFTDNDAGFGRTLVIDHGNGFSTRYAHLQRFQAKTGQTVNRGEVIAYLGNSGRTTGPNLYYEIRLNGVPVNPAKYILN